jgi:hypothetical protein
MTDHAIPADAAVLHESPALESTEEDFVVSRSITRVLQRMTARERTHVVLIINEDRTVSISSRADLAQHFRANDVDSLARECMSRRVPPGAVLALSLRTTPPRFALVDPPSRCRR